MPTTARGAIRIRGLSRTYTGGAVEIRALDQVALDIPAGSFVSVVGRSGSGKTTLLNIIGGLDREWTGEVEVAGASLQRLGDVDLARFRNDRVGFVFQSHNLLPNLTLLENVLLPCTFASGRPDVARARMLLERVGLGGRAAEYPARLSGGQSQRVAIARALIRDADVLLCDEPTGSLDTDTAAEVLQLFREVHSERGCTFVIVTHEASVSRQSERIIEMRDGRVVSDSPVEAP